MPPDCTVAVGDEQNDISMIQTAHVGVAMKNGIDELKKVADYVTENDNNHDAIAE
jgi:hydroxymethylpyrimidine pyrophosphatase-like HAD family hydrolase